MNVPFMSADTSFVSANAPFVSANALFVGINDNLRIKLANWLQVQNVK